jgi:hypothetical protein
MVAVPADTPETIPEVEPTVAIAGAELDQRPPGVASPKVVVLPTHTFAEPVIAPGTGVTVIVLIT